jgi:NADH dehydrogenase FAD-containing subunit
MWVYHRGQRAAGKRRVVIVGGGFAGLYAALELDRTLGHDRDLEVVVIDRNNYFLFPPLLPSAATGSIETRQVTYPFRRIFATSNIRFEKANVEQIDPVARRVHTAAGPILGDAACLLDEKTGKPLPPLGQVAFQQGPHAAGNVIRLLEGRPTRPFRYFNFGSLVSVGEHFAAVNLLGVCLSGFPGWFVWRTLYLAKLVGMSSKVRVMLDWTLDLLIERSIAQLGSAPRPGPARAGGDVAAGKASAAA